MNPAIAAVPGSLIRALHARRGPATIDLGIGQPTLAPDIAYFERATAWTAKHGCRYSSNLGDEDLREMIAVHYAYPGLAAPGNVCVTNGSAEAVYVALRSLIDVRAGDEVLVVEPAFPIYVKIAQVEGMALRRVFIDPRSQDGFDPQAILGAITPQTRVIVICSPSNPTGRVITQRSVDEIARGLLARDGPPVYVLHDEIYREIAFTDDVGTFGSVYPHTIAINSLSKSNALTGLRIGWAIAPAEVMAQLVKMHGWVSSCANTFGQRIAAEIFAANDLGGHRAWYAAQRSGVLATLGEIGLEHVVPEGAFYVCVRVGGDTLAFSEELVVTHDVIAIPGDIFAPEMAGWLRTSFVSPLADVRTGLTRIAALRDCGLPDESLAEWAT